MYSQSKIYLTTSKHNDNAGDMPPTTVAILRAISGERSTKDGYHICNTRFQRNSRPAIKNWKCFNWYDVSPHKLNFVFTYPYLKINKP